MYVIPKRVPNPNIQDLAGMMMDILKGKWKENVILKAWERCRSFGGSTNSYKRSRLILKSSNSSKSLPENYNNNYYNNDDIIHDDENKNNKKKGKIIMAPNGCFSVYVGPNKQRFVVKTEYASHPLFMMLLDEAEMEYGFGSDGPIWLPCTVDLFYKVLAEMDDGGRGGEIHNSNVCRKSFAKTKGYSLDVLLSPARFLCHHMNNGGTHDAYGKVMDSEMLRINHFQ